MAQECDEDRVWMLITIELLGGTLDPLRRMRLESRSAEAPKRGPSAWLGDVRDR